MIIIVDRGRMHEFFIRLVASGMDVDEASKLLGFTPAQGYYLSEKTGLQKNKKGKPYVTKKLLEIVWNMLDEGFTVDEIAAATGLSSQQIIDYALKEF